MHFAHSFHIPVMGLGYTIDTPLKVSQYGIDSVISLGDDMLMEKLRKFYCNKFNLPYQEITDQEKDARALRITAYLNLIHDQAVNQFNQMKRVFFSESDALKKYFQMLPDTSPIKQGLRQLIAEYSDFTKISNWVQKNLVMGSIDVNIMTKVDKDNYYKGEKLPVEYNDAHAALRGYAHSTLSSGIILSAGMNQKLFAYMEQFEDFYPDQKGALKKRIILKVSDYRSAFIQGKYLVKRGLWVSEFRVESGLNCGGHAFATDGSLLGPVLAEFQQNKESLTETLFSIYQTALQAKNKSVPEKALPIKITAQGGVGTEEEHQFLIDQFQVDSVGWGTPFLLVPEATAVDEETLKQLERAREEDLYLSNISPFGIPFHNLRGNTKDTEKNTLIQKGKPGSSCPKRLLALNLEFGEKSICTASREYQYYKLKQLETESLAPEAKQLRYGAIIEKSCICVGLGTSALLKYHLDTKREGPGVSICPGPNLAYFSRRMTLQEMVDHIYGRTNVIERKDRPNFILNELNLYIDYFKTKIKEIRILNNLKAIKDWIHFANNLLQSIQFYESLLQKNENLFRSGRTELCQGLTEAKESINGLLSELNVLQNN